MSRFFKSKIEHAFLTSDLVVRSVICAAVIALSYVSAPYYYSGDQILYNEIYDKVVGLSLHDAWLFYQKKIYTKELGHFYIVYFFSSLIDKQILMSLANGILAYFAVYAMQLLKAHNLIIVWTVIINYYFWVLYLPAERLKFAFLFMAISVCFYLMRGLKSILTTIPAALAVACHMQIMVFPVMYLMRTVHKKFRLRRENIWQVLVIVAVIAIIAYYYYSPLTTKLMHAIKYHQLNLLEMGPVMLMLVLSYHYSNRDNSVLFAFLPLVIGIMLIGGDRLNMMGYFVFLFYACQFNHGINAGLIFLNVYLTYKTYIFFNNILAYGNGFG